MNQILARLFSNPAIGLELLIATFLANALALASPIFVMQVLNRYVAFGVDTTLLTLASGAVIAIIFEFAFRRVRLIIAERRASVYDEEIGNVGAVALLRTSYPTMSVLNSHAHQQAVSGADTIRQAYGAANLMTFLDVPFALLFLGLLYLLSPALAAIATVFLGISLLMSLSTLLTLRKPNSVRDSAAATRSTLSSSAVRSAETTRIFDRTGMLQKKWQEMASNLRAAETDMARRQDFIQTGMTSLVALMSIFLMGTGAYLAVRGQVDIGALVAANILAARALTPISRLGAAARQLAAARTAIKTLQELAKLTLERRDGEKPGKFKGALAFDDVMLTYRNAKTPLFESLSLSLEPGQTLAVTGPNGSGKTTIAKMISGLLEPSRGRVLVDGMDLSQIAPPWWRGNISYLPQEPTFLPGTIRENLTAVNPKLEDTHLQTLIDASGLRTFIDESREGLDTEFVNGGLSFALGIRRRLALARALAVGGKIMIVDEPTEGLDQAGAKLVYAAMNRHSKAGGTIIACSHDPNILKGADWVLDLNRKPQPRVSRIPRSANADEKAEAGE